MQNGILSFCVVPCCVELSYCALLLCIGVVLGFYFMCLCSVASIPTNNSHMREFNWNLFCCIVAWCVVPCCLVSLWVAQCRVLVQCIVPWRVATHWCTRTIDTSKGDIALHRIELHCISVPCSTVWRCIAQCRIVLRCNVVRRVAP